MVSALRKLVRLWILYATMDVVLVTADKWQCLSWFLCDLVLNAASVAGMLLLVERFRHVGPWTRPEMVFMMAYAALVHGLINALFNRNVIAVSRRVGRGQLDHLLVVPQSLWVSLLTEGFMPVSGLAGMAPGILLLAVSLPQLNVSHDLLWSVAFLLSLTSSVAIVFGYQFLWGSLAFWFPRAAEEVCSSSLRMLDQLRPFPLDGLGSAGRTGLLTLVPAGLLAWYPCSALLHPAFRGQVMVTPAAAIVSLLVGCSVFNRGMDFYARTGSQRYGDRGHRR